MSRSTVRILSVAPAATQQGSDQIIGSTRGDMDAGRGSKTVRVPSGPEITTDLNGNTIGNEAMEGAPLPERRRALAPGTAPQAIVEVLGQMKLPRPRWSC